MPGQDEDHLLGLSSNVELHRFTRFASLPTQITTEFAQMGSPLSVNQRYENVHQLKHEELCKKTNEIMLQEEGRDIWSSGSGGGRHDQPLNSEPLGLYNNPDCTICPSSYKTKSKYSKDSVFLDRKLHYIPCGDADGCATKSYFPIINPHTKAVQKWNKFFFISYLVAFFIDPLFFFIFSMHKYSKCIVVDWSLMTILASVRSITDFIYLLRMLLQFRLAYVATERVKGTETLVDQPEKIAVRYLRGYFALDLFVLLPLPQVMLLVVIPKYGGYAANFAKHLINATVPLQYLLKVFRLLPLIADQSVGGFIFEPAWASFMINILLFLVAGHVVGSFWYLFGLQRVTQCLRFACALSSIQSCRRFIDCGRGLTIDSFSRNPAWQEWLNDSVSSECFSIEGVFSYGIYEQAVDLTAESAAIARYMYSLFWGFQQIGTLGGNLTPSHYIWEIMFSLLIVGAGLFVYPLLIGNMQNFVLARGRRHTELQLRRRDIEQWMRHHHLPKDLRRRVKGAENFSWTATRGVDEEDLLNKLPDDLQRDLRRHFFKFLKKVRLFSSMDEPILDAVYQKLRKALYVQGSIILYQGGSVEKMVFIVGGKMESSCLHGKVAILSAGDMCGEELLTWYLENLSSNKESRKVWLAEDRLNSNRTVKCLTNVEAFTLQAADLEELDSLFYQFLQNPHVQAEIRYRSSYWRNEAATRIQVAWRYRNWRLKQGNTSQTSGQMI